MNTKDVIREFVMEQFLKDSSEQTLGDDASFLEEGIIDSVGVLELVAFLEEKFGLTVEDEELSPENLDSLARLVDYVDSKLAVRK